jgi:hypothetical protein
MCSDAKIAISAVQRTMYRYGSPAKRFAPPGVITLEPAGIVFVLGTFATLGPAGIVAAGT